MPSHDTAAEQCIVPCLIPAFNNPTYVRQTIAQLARFPDLKLFILDNGSTYGPMLEFCAEADRGRYGDTKVLRLGCNAGPRAAWYNLLDMPKFFCITDPDLELNPELPDDFVRRLIDLTEIYQIGKAGFALNLADRDRMWQNTFRHCEGWMTIWEAETRHWRVPLPDHPAIGEPLFLANIDTTFAVYNKTWFDIRHPWDAVRVAGRYTCRHLPWYKDTGLPAEEEEFYRQATEFSYYMGDRPARQVREVFAQQDRLASQQLPAQPERAGQ
jgi:Glycosyl transferase family 2